MTRRIVWTACVVAVLATAVGAWFLNAFEPVAVPYRHGIAAEARRDPHLALERFLARMGRPLTRTSDPEVIDRLEPRSVLLLDVGRRYQLTAERSTRLLRWVADGGYLVVAAENDADSDAIIKTLDLRWYEPEVLADDEIEAESDSDDATKLPEAVAVPIPGAGRTLSAGVGGFGMRVGQVAPDWMAGAPATGAQFVHFTYGQGSISVIAHLAPLADNQRIGERDHADIIWSLLQRYQPTGAIMMVSRMHVPTLFEWLGTHAIAPLASLSVLIALALWRAGPRSGRLALDLPPARRELREHLRAIGLFMWRSGELPALAASARQAVLALASARRFAAHAAPIETPADTPRAFTASMRRLQQLESKP